MVDIGSTMLIEGYGVYEETNRMKLLDVWILLRQNI